jgi:hypothetical protein
MLSRAHKSLRRFSPTDFGGALCLWLEADQLDTLFTTVAGSTTPADTGTVGRWVDKSINGFNLTATGDDTTRPTWNLNGGLPYLNFDGSNDLLRRTADLGLHGAARLDGYSFFIACRGNPATGSRLFTINDTASTNTLYAVCQADGTTASTNVCSYRNNAGGAQDIAQLPLLVNAYDNADRVIGVTDSGTVVTAYRDGGNAAIRAYTNTGTYTMNVTTMGAMIRTTTANWWAGRVYAAVAVKRMLKQDEIRDLTKYLGAKAGLAL